MLGRLLLCWDTSSEHDDTDSRDSVLPIGHQEHSEMILASIKWLDSASEWNNCSHRSHIHGHSQSLPCLPSRAVTNDRNSEKENSIIIRLEADMNAFIAFSLNKSFKRDGINKKHIRAVRKSTSWYRSITVVIWWSPARSVSGQSARSWSTSPFRSYNGRFPLLT